MCAWLLLAALPLSAHAADARAVDARAADAQWQEFEQPTDYFNEALFSAAIQDFGAETAKWRSWWQSQTP